MIQQLDRVISSLTNLRTAIKAYERVGFQFELPPSAPPPPKTQSTQSVSVSQKTLFAFLRRPKTTADVAHRFGWTVKYTSKRLHRNGFKRNGNGAWLA